MNAPDPLSLLKDIHLGAPATVWPPAPIFYLVAFAFAVMLILLWPTIRAAWRQYQQKDFCMRFINEVKSTHAHPASHHQLVHALNEILKRYARVRFPHIDTAPLYGETWCMFLEKRTPGLVFREGVGAVLGQGGYSKHIEVDVDALCQLVKKWIKEAR